MADKSDERVKEIKKLANSAAAKLGMVALLADHRSVNAKVRDKVKRAIGVVGELIFEAGSDADGQETTTPPSGNN